MIKNFLEYIEVEKRYSQNTIKSYRKDLMDFANFVLESEGIEDLRKVDKKIVRNFIVRQSESGLIKRSINRKISSLKSFYNFLLKISEVKKTPLESISILKFYPEKQVPFSKEEMLRLSEILEEEGIDLLEKLIIEVLYQTGMRRAELIELKISDIDFSQKIVKVLGKRNKERIIPLIHTVVETLEKYLTLRKEVETNEVFLFLTDKGKKMYPKLVYNIINSYFKSF